MTKKRLIKILRKAADLLDERGWCRGELQDEKGRMCIVAALGKVAPDCFGDDWLSLEGALNVPQGLVGWNNKIARDKRTVTRRLRSAATRLERA